MVYPFEVVWSCMGKASGMALCPLTFDLKLSSNVSSPHLYSPGDPDVIHRTSRYACCDYTVHHTTKFGHILSFIMHVDWCISSREERRGAKGRGRHAQLHCQLICLGYVLSTHTTDFDLLMRPFFIVTFFFLI